MCKHVLLVVDVQNDFITGSLGSAAAVATLPNIRRKVQEYSDRGDRIIFTQDTHGDNYFGTHEGRLLPVAHCLKYSHGWEVEESVKAISPGSRFICKSTFGYPDWSSFSDIINGDEIELIGFCTDICVVSNALALRAAYFASDITVDASCCAGTSKEAHEAALTVMRSCQIEVINDMEDAK